jgi:hypothetical protein
MEKVKNLEQLNPFAVKSGSPEKRMSLVEIKSMLDTLNHANSMIYGKGAAKIVDKLDPVKLEKIKQEK